MRKAQALLAVVVMAGTVGVATGNDGAKNTAPAPANATNTNTPNTTNNVNTNTNTNANVNNNANNTVGKTAPAATTNTKNNDNTTNAPTFQAFAGEWDGGVTFSDGSTSNSSIASMSAQIDATGAFVAAFEGFSKGQAFEGAFSVRLDGGNQPLLTSFCSWNNFTASARQNAVGATFRTFTGSYTKNNQTTPVEITWSTPANNRVVVSFFALGTDGSRNEFMSLDLSRLPNGQTAAAYPLLSNNQLMARVGGNSLRREASVPTDKN